MQTCRGRPISPVWPVVACALWLASLGNIPLWRTLAGLGLLRTSSGLVFGLCLLVFIFAGTLALLGALAFRATLKVTASTLLVTAASCSYFMGTYGIVMDPGMITNVLQTDLHEAAALFSWQFVGMLVALAVVPMALLWRLPVAHGSAARQLGRSAGLVAVGLALAAAALLPAFQTAASVMRNHREVRYLINPLAALYGAGRAAMPHWSEARQPLARVGADARLAPAASAGAHPPLLVLVLGETARSGNFSINGYGRRTSAHLEQEGAISFRNAWACGTSTAASVPCMFTDLGREGFDRRRGERESVLDVLQRAGLAVLWIDNQSGCKGVCDRVPSVRIAGHGSAGYCADGECLDGVMLDGLDARIGALDPRRVARGVVIVMHQMGSHGPAYHQRSPASGKLFVPECASAALQDCSREAVVNAYDNSIAYTDRFLGRVIDWLRSKSADSDTAMLYVSDHGESLGENSIYLHGLPYAIAPDVQKRVPWISWLSEGFQHANELSAQCLRAAGDRPVSHDHYFHSVLGLLNVQTSAYKPSLDAYAACRSREGQVAVVAGDRRIPLSLRGAPAGPTTMRHARTGG